MRNVEGASETNAQRERQTDRQVGGNRLSGREGESGRMNVDTDKGRDRICTSELKSEC